MRLFKGLKLRICFAIEEFFPVPSGRLKRVYEIAKRLARNNEVHIYCQNYSGLSGKNIDGIYIHQLGLPISSTTSFLKRALSTISQFLSLLREARFDVVNTNWLFPPIPSYLAARLKRTPIVLTSDGILWHYVNKMNLTNYDSLTVLFGCMMEDIDVSLKYDAFIAVSLGAKEELVSMGINPHKVFVVYNGVDLEIIDSIVVKEEINPTICYVGHLEERKNILDLLKAFAIVVREVPETKLIIAGDGPLKGKAVKLARALRVSKNVKFKGRVDFEEALRIIKSSHVLALPSLIEGFGLVLAEANACGKPVIAYNIRNVREIVNDGFNGFLVQPKNIKMLAERLIEVIVDSKLRRRMGKNGRKIVEKKFTWEKAAEKTQEVFEYVTQKHR